jgi:hypothetical protein
MCNHDMTMVAVEKIEIPEIVSAASYFQRTRHLLLSVFPLTEYQGRMQLYQVHPKLILMVILRSRISGYQMRERHKLSR